MSNIDLTIILICAIGTLLAQTFIAIRLDSAIYKFERMIEDMLYDVSEIRNIERDKDQVF
jgi:hypothetical protein